MRWYDPRQLLYLFLRLVRLPLSIHWLAVYLINQHFLLGVVGVILDEQGQMLLFYHTYRRRTPWGLPGGWMVRGESPLKAFEREVYEESGLTVRAESLLMIGTTPDRPKLEFVVRARLVEGTFRPSGEVSAARWFSSDQLPPIAPFQRAILSQVASASPGEIGWYVCPWRFEQRQRAGKGKV